MKPNLCAPISNQSQTYTKNLFLNHTRINLALITACWNFGVHLHKLEIKYQYKTTIFNVVWTTLCPDPQVRQLKSSINNMNYNHKPKSLTLTDNIHWLNKHKLTHIPLHPKETLNNKSQTWHSFSTKIPIHHMMLLQ